MELMNDPASASGDMLNDLSDAHLKLCLSRAEARFQKTSSVLGQQHSRYDGISNYSVLH